MARLLFVDDNPYLSNFTIQAIARHFPALEVVHADNHACALEAVERIAPEYVVTDIQLPDGDGVLLIEQIRSMLPGTRIIVLSADATVLDAARRMLSVVGVLAKPCPVECLLAVIEETMNSGEACSGERQAPARAGRRPGEAPMGDDLARMLAEIVEDGDRLREVVQEMLRYSCRMDESVTRLSRLVARITPTGDRMPPRAGWDSR
jgi:DNA-binding NtrC family response regulator